MRLLRLDYPEAEQMYRRMVFNVLARNCDDHTKNFAFVMDKSGEWKLAPAYDICHAYRPDSPWVSQQSLTINGKRQDINRDDLTKIASEMSIKKAGDILDHTASILKEWPKYAKQCAINSDLETRIQETFIWLK